MVAWMSFLMHTISSSQTHTQCTLRPVKFLIHIISSSAIIIHRFFHPKN
jgi:hypothetical protein